MSLFDLLKLNPIDLWTKITDGGIRPIVAKRWSLSVDDENFGNVITSHTVGVDAVGAWAKWTYSYDDDRDPATPIVSGEIQSWIKSDRSHVIKHNGNDVEKDSVIAKVTTVGVWPIRGVVIVKHRFVENGDAREFRFDGRL